MLKNKTFKAKYGAAYSGLKEVDGKYITHQLFFFYRRLILMTFLIYFESNLISQFITVTVTQLATVMLLALRRPFKSVSRNKVELAEECAIMISMYHLFCFTEYIPDPLVKHYVGYSLIVCIILHLLIFLLGISIFSTKRGIRTCKTAIYKRRARKELKTAIRPGKSLKRRRAEWAKEQRRIDRKQALEDARSSSEEEDDDQESESDQSVRSNMS